MIQGKTQLLQLAFSDLKSYNNDQEGDNVLHFSLKNVFIKIVSKKGKKILLITFHPGVLGNEARVDILI